MRRSLVCGMFALAAVVAACGNSVSANSGIGEPILVRNGQFFDGAFPGTADSTPSVSQVMLKNSEFSAGTVGKAVSGLTTSDAQSVALALKGFGRGYWVVPVGAPDLLEVGSFTWSATCDFARDLPAGMQGLLLAAADSRGHFGPALTQTLNILPYLPTGHVVASLSWGSDADLDLHLVGPSGKELDPKHPNSAELYDAGEDAGQPMPGSGLLDRDSNAGCVPDGRRMENVVWDGNPEVGTYVVRVDMFSACSKPAANFTFSLYVDGQRVLEKSGRLLDIDADGGGPGSGLFVTEFNCEGTGTCS